MAGLFGGHSSTSTSDTALNSVSLQQSTYGLAVPILFGKNRVKSNLFEYTDFTAIPHTTTQKTGGKGGGSSTVSSTTYTYTVSLMMALGEGIVTGIGKVWKGSDITNMFSLGLELYGGSFTQNSWPYMVSKHPERAIPYRGVAYVAGAKFDLGSSSSIPNLNYEYISLGSKNEFKGDAIPTFVLETILTDSSFGAGFPVERIGDLTPLENYVIAAGIFISPIIESKKECQEYITDIAQITNSQPVWSQGKLKMVPYSLETITGNGRTYIASNNPQYTLTDDDFISSEGSDPIELTRNDTTDAYNFQQLEYSNRNNSYNVETVDADDLANIELVGLRTADVVTAKSICEPSVAKIVVQNILNRNLYQRNSYTVKLSWKYCLLDPMDLVSLISGYLGLDNTLCRITKIEDSVDMDLTVTVEEVYGSTSGVTLHPSQSADRSSVAYNVNPGNINAPIILNAPAEATSSGLETWIAASGVDMINWGGCNVWVAEMDSENYKMIGQIQGPARMGSLTTPLDLTGDIFTVGLLGTDALLSGSPTDSQNLNTLCYVGGELLAYSTSTLSGVRSYTLSGLTRPAYNTLKSSHAIGTKFARLDNAIFKYPFDQSQLGKNLSFKFTSFNVFGGAEQSLADVVAYNHSLTMGEFPQVTNIQIYQHLRSVGDGTNLYELEVDWTPPNTSIYNYSDVYMKTSQPNWEEVDMTWNDMTSEDSWDGLVSNQTWKYIGKAYDKITIPGCSTGQTFTVKIRAVSTQQNFKADFNNAPEYSHEVKIKSYVPLTPTNLTVDFSTVCTWSWGDNGNSDNDFYELRTDLYAGETINKLAKTTSLKAVVMPPTRKGQAYLFAHNTSGKYSPYVMVEYNKPAPIAPVVTVTEVFQGLVISCNTLPNYSLGINVYVDGVMYFSQNNSYTFKATSGIFDIQVAVVDLFGEGDKSSTITKTVVPRISQDLLDAEAVSLANMDATIKDAIAKAQVSINETIFTDTKNTLMKSDANNASAIQQNADSITQAVTNFNGQISQVQQTATGISQTVQSNKITQDGVNSSFSSQINQQAGQITQVVTDLNSSNTVIAQNTSAIQLRATKADLISLINVCPEAITILGKFIHITGDTVFDDNVIVGRMLSAGSISTDKLAAGSINTDKLAAGSITGDKLNVSSLSAITATIGTLRTSTTGARTEISDNIIKVYDSNNVLRVRMGVW